MVLRRPLLCSPPRRGCLQAPSRNSTFPAPRSWFVDGLPTLERSCTSPVSLPGRFGLPSDRTYSPWILARRRKRLVLRHANNLQLHGFTRMSSISSSQIAVLPFRIHSVWVPLGISSSSFTLPYHRSFLIQRPCMQPNLPPFRLPSTATNPTDCPSSCDFPPPSIQCSAAA